MKRLAVFLDGTWNEPGDQTNVHRLSSLVAPAAAGVEQHVLYLTGVGTRWYDHLSGGIVGAGLSDNVRAAYSWLVDRYDDGDEIFVFGFSRGAYTARSLVGVIIKCGLLRRPARIDVDAIYSRYQRGKQARPIYDLAHAARRDPASLTTEEKSVLANSRRVPVKMIGVWESVGALGIPWTAAPLIGRGQFYFHNTNLSVLVENAFHALAIDENRGPYSPTLWTKFQPLVPDPVTTVGAERSTQTIEQRWFIGAHSNVGGGYGDKDRLARVPLAWIQARAIECGLGFSERVVLTGDEFQCAPRDSFTEFMKGLYRLIRLGKRSYRTIGRGITTVKGGTSTPINETIDATVFRRVRTHADYRPANLLDWAKRRGVDLSTQDGDADA